MVGIPTYTPLEIRYILQAKRKNLGLQPSSRKSNAEIAQETMKLNEKHKRRFHEIPPNGVNYIWHKHKDDPNPIPRATPPFQGLSRLNSVAPSDIHAFKGLLPNSSAEMQSSHHGQVANPSNLVSTFYLDMNGRGYNLVGFIGRSAVYIGDDGRQYIHKLVSPNEVHMEPLENHLVPIGRSNYSPHRTRNSSHAHAQNGSVIYTSPSNTSPLVPIPHELAQQFHASQGHHNSAMSGSTGSPMSATHQLSGNPYVHPQQSVQPSTNHFQQRQNPSFQNERLVQPNINHSQQIQNPAFHTGHPVCIDQFPNRPPPNSSVAHASAQISYMHAPVQSRQHEASQNLPAPGFTPPNVGLSVENSSVTQLPHTINEPSLMAGMDGFALDDWVLSNWYQQADSHGAVEKMPTTMDNKPDNPDPRTPNTPAQFKNVDSLTIPKTTSKRGATSMNTEPSAKRPKVEPATQVLTPTSIYNSQSSVSSSVQPSSQPATVNSSPFLAHQMQGMKQSPQATHDPQQASSGTNNRLSVGHMVADGATNTTGTMNSDTSLLNHQEVEALIRQGLDTTVDRDLNLIAIRYEKSQRSMFRKMLLGSNTLEDYLQGKVSPGTQPDDAEIDAFYPVPSDGMDLEPYPHWVTEWRKTHPEEMFEDWPCQD
ncbi:hypothetical protein ACMFMG_009869 [Clarireedia jacksonii]